jgi:hypothetical protein
MVKRVGKNGSWKVRPFGVPVQIVMDESQILVSKLIGDLLASFGVKHPNEVPTR